MKVEYDSDTGRALRLNGERVTLDDNPEKALAVLGGGLAFATLLAVIGSGIAVAVAYTLGLTMTGYLLAGGIGLCLGVVLPFLALFVSKRVLV